MFLNGVKHVHNVLMGCYKIFKGKNFTKFETTYVIIGDGSTHFCYKQEGQCIKERLA